jgi:hypothetical protein
VQALKNVHSRKTLVQSNHTFNSNVLDFTHLSEVMDDRPLNSQRKMSMSRVNVRRAMNFEENN